MKYVVLWTIHSMVWIFAIDTVEDRPFIVFPWSPFWNWRDFDKKAMSSQVRQGWPVRREVFGVDKDVPYLLNISDDPLLSGSITSFSFLSRSRKKTNALVLRKKSFDSKTRGTFSMHFLKVAPWVIRLLLKWCIRQWTMTSWSVNVRCLIYFIKQGDHTTCGTGDQNTIKMKGLGPWRAYKEAQSFAAPPTPYQQTKPSGRGQLWRACSRLFQREQSE